MSRSRRTRVSIASVPLLIQPAADDVASFPTAGFGEDATELPPTADDRADGRRRFEVVVNGWRFEASVEPADRAELRERALRAAAEHQVGGEATLRAQIPGRVVRVWVADGDSVEQGQRLLAIEAMKMENEIRAPRAGNVRRIKVDVGALIERGDELLSIS